MAKILIGTYEATIYPEAEGYTGAISLGFDPDGKRQRLKRKGRTKTAVKDKLIKAVKDLEAGITASENYTVRDAVNDWLDKGLKDRSERTVTKLRILADRHVIPKLGKAKLHRLRADDVDEWLDELASELSTRTLRDVHSIVKRAIRQAQARDLVLRNVAELVTTPRAPTGGPARRSPGSRRRRCSRPQNPPTSTPTWCSASPPASGPRRLARCAGITSSPGCPAPSPGDR
ncbi:hypothetical protein Pta02_14910 [Planobispora takensis]|uniref:Core-binding (CB) domain-containing protein n=1 Tax=Planobispora takensis TaxID=1367882 RepID=A0A8J3WSN8_9ACTN|nr:hypothetical protein Pta02_14910 [Planobispora takensis]